MDTETHDPSALWRNRIAASRTRREDRIAEWQRNVQARIGGVRRSADTTSTIRESSSGVSINQDWPLTKAKIAQLYSQTPEIRLTPRSPDFSPAVQPFGRELNAVISDANVGATIEEVLADVVNASGIGAVLVSCDVRTALREVPAMDPALLPPAAQQAIMTGAMDLPMVQVEQTADLRYLVQRISPVDLLIPDDFTGSTYNTARWIGEEGRMTWPQAVAAFKLTEDIKEKVCGVDARTSGHTRTLDPETSKFHDTDVVQYTQIFYWRHFYHADETNFSAIQRIVFVEGIEAPVIDEPYAAQERLEDGRIVGVTKLPIQALTLTYISDSSLPPSDSSIGRFPVDELERSRDAMVQQRKHSAPIRWGDTNRVSPNSRAKLDQGNFQDFIWTNGPGERALGEVARASYPSENFEFDRVIKNDLTEIWQVGTNQAGAFASGERSASEARIVQQNFSTRVGQERDKVTRFFVAIAEVLAGHLALYGTFDLPDEIGIERQALATGFSYAVRADSTVRLDAQQRIEQIAEFVNRWAQSGFLNPKPLAEEHAVLIGLDPAAVVIDPQPKPPEPVKINVSSAEDLRDPVMLATLARTHQLPVPQDVQAAHNFLRALEQMGFGLMALPPPPPSDAPPPEVVRPGIRNADWQEQPTLNKREQDAA